MKNLNLLSKAEMKNVIGGVAAVEGDFCVFTVTYDNGQVGTDINSRYVPGGSSGANSQCVTWIEGSSYGVAHCSYNCMFDGWNT